ncbi:Protein N-acetyltransferase, RimJ/RimL family [Agreia bicolorata]|uniref:Protein N-acetyltransferase, RimJ/RimL family n=1 Tax=Agreia bicolorata TaxID=110935 RepID=A0A1T4X995_9MICO|nr:GNAT family N-acetyltransferase [Agreia bicolorata]SKA86133.1 Protein N-acetyltransferase, RimJ/RimL family [Agreia bicolorata]
MIADYWPVFNLQLKTERLVLRSPSDDELAALAGVAADGVHAPGESPYLVPWTEGTPRQRAVHVIQQHWRRRGEWTPESWALELGLFVEERPVGMVAMRAQDFRVRREVKTESWLGVEFQRRGLGTEARAALLHLAFAALGAESAVSEVFQDNAGSQGVSRRLGYRRDGVSRDMRDGRVVVSDRLRLDRTDWVSAERMSVTVTGVASCLALFGAAQIIDDAHMGAETEPDA